jgi:hypothetical protein
MRHQTVEAGKLAELRALTDRQLVALLTSQLDRGFALARQLQLEDGEGYDEVTRLCSEIGRVLPVVSRPDRIRLQSRLADLESMLGFEVSMQAAS